MENLNAIKWIICRICLKSSVDKMFKIFPKDADTIAEDNLADKIHECGGIALNASSNLPDKICKKCLTLLRVSIKFRSLCKKSQHNLAEILQLNNPLVKEANMTDKTIDDNAKQCMLFIPDMKLKQEEPTREENSCDSQYVIVVEENDHIDAELNVEEVIEEVDTEYVEYQNLNHNEGVDFLQDSIRDLDSEENSNSINEALNKKEIFLQPSEEFIMLTKEKNFKTESGKRKNPGAQQIDNDFKIVQKFTNLQKPEKKRRTKSTNNAIVKVEEETSTSFICFQCGNIYAERSKLSLHLKVHNKDKPHECEICHKRFAQTPQLSRHMNSHTGSRPFKCKFCSSSFADPSTCIKHERIHTNERPYVCDICGKAFSYSNVLKVHMMMHTGEKPYSCLHCDKKFAQLHHKKSHERTHNTQALVKQEAEDNEDAFDN